RETLYPVFLGQLFVLLSHFGRERLRARKIYRHQDEVVFRVLLKFRPRENFPLQFDAPDAPIRPSEIEQEKFLARFGFGLGLMKIGKPMRGIRPPRDERNSSEQKIQGDNASEVHANHSLILAAPATGGARAPQMR